MILKNLIAAASFSPNLVPAPSAWLGHLSFSSWVIQEVSPKIFVELGTHYGHSYFSFCQTVAEANISTKCYAVDTWQGDDHAGRYGDDIFNQVNAYHQAKYSEFSRLLRMTFDDASDYFADGSIDLLHIDGCHSYDAVKHDFETWLPKLAAGAVVLFHDTNVRERGFGVWKLWEELQSQYPLNIEFAHSHGLGVLQLANGAAEKQLSWLHNGPDEQQVLKNYFAALGNRQAERYELIDIRKTMADSDGQIAELNQAMADRDGQIAELNQAMADRDGQIAELNQSVADRDGQIAELNQSVAERDGQSAGLNQSVAERDGQIAELNQAVVERDVQIVGLNQAMVERDGQIIILHQRLVEKDDQLARLYASRSWRVTAPLRWAGHQARRVRLLIRVVPLAIEHTGGVKTCLEKGVGIARREGLAGVRRRLRLVFENRAMQGTQTGDSNEKLSRNLNRPRLSHHAQSVDVVVCVHNALQDVQHCLESVLRQTQPPYRLIIVDDGSDQETASYLAQFVVGQQALLIRHEEAKGYTRAANAGLRASFAPFVVLLNSDTIVTPRWLDRLIQCATSDPRVGMAGPLSNTASWQSVPHIFNEQGDWTDNPLPDGIGLDAYAAEIARESNCFYPRVGFLNGFCLLIKRELLAAIGLFDEEVFGRGYGEENDYCLRAAAARWQLAVADDCYVYHAQSKSYSQERRKKLAALADQALDNKHGSARIQAGIAITRHHLGLAYTRQRCGLIPSLSALRAELMRLYEGLRVLFLLPAGTAGGGGNIVLLECSVLRSLGVDAWVANLQNHQRLFEQSHPNLDVPVLYLQNPADLASYAQGFDAVIATLYLTVIWLQPLRDLPSPPRLGYYIQDFEPDFFEPGSLEYQQALDSYTILPELCLVTKTRWNAETLQQRLGVTATVIGPSLALESYNPSPLNRCGASDVVRIVAMVRPSTPRRAPALTMRVLKQLKERFQERVAITIFGVDPQNAEYDRLEHDFAHDCRGELPMGAVWEVLAAADIFVDCSSFQAMGLTAMEAMASGVAVVGPQNGGLAELIVHGVNGMLVDTSDQQAIVATVVQLIEDAGLRRRMQEAGLEIVAHHPLYSAGRILDSLFPVPGREA